MTKVKKNNTCMRAFLVGWLLLWKWACEIVTSMDIEGKGCVEPTANMESGVFLYRWWPACLPLLCTHLMGSPSLSANTAAFLITTLCALRRLFNHSSLVAPDQI